MNLPPTVKIGPVEYTVKVNQRFPQDSLAGQIRYLEQVIEIQPNMGDTVTRVTLWHEILHGVLFAGGFRDQDEHMIDVLAYGIVQLLQDNPFLKANMIDKNVIVMTGKGATVGPAIPYLDEALVNLNFLLSEYPDKEVLEIHRSHLENIRKKLMLHRATVEQAEPA